MHSPGTSSASPVIQNRVVKTKLHDGSLPRESMKPPTLDEILNTSWEDGRNTKVNCERTNEKGHRRHKSQELQKTRTIRDSIHHVLNEYNELPQPPPKTSGDRMTSTKDDSYDPLVFPPLPLHECSVQHQPLHSTRRESKNPFKGASRSLTAKASKLHQREQSGEPEKRPRSKSDSFDASMPSAALWEQRADSPMPSPVSTFNKCDISSRSSNKSNRSGSSWKHSIQVTKKSCMKKSKPRSDHGSLQHSPHPSPKTNHQSFHEPKHSPPSPNMKPHQKTFHKPKHRHSPTASNKKPEPKPSPRRSPRAANMKPYDASSSQMSMLQHSPTLSGTEPQGTIFCAPRHGPPASSVDSRSRSSKNIHTKRTEKEAPKSTQPHPPKTKTSKKKHSRMAEPTILLDSEGSVSSLESEDSASSTKSIRTIEPGEEDGEEAPLFDFAAKLNIIGKSGGTISAKDLQELVAMMQVESEKLRREKESAEMKAQKLETDLVAMEEAHEIEFVSLNQEIEHWKITAELVRVQYRSLQDKVDMIEGNNTTIKLKCAEAEKGNVAAAGKLKEMKEENQRLEELLSKRPSSKTSSRPKQDEQNAAADPPASDRRIPGPPSPPSRRKTLKHPVPPPLARPLNWREYIDDGPDRMRLSPRTRSSPRAPPRRLPGHSKTARLADSLPDLNRSVPTDYPVPRPAASNRKQQRKRPSSNRGNAALQYPPRARSVDGLVAMVEDLLEEGGCDVSDCRSGGHNYQGGSSSRSIDGARSLDGMVVMMESLLDDAHTMSPIGGGRS